MALLGTLVSRVAKPRETNECDALPIQVVEYHLWFWTQVLGFGDFYYELAVQVGAHRVVALQRCLLTVPLPVVLSARRKG